MQKRNLSSNHFKRTHSFLTLLSLATHPPSTHDTLTTQPHSTPPPYQNALTTRDYRLDRVRVFIEEDKTVARTPAQG